MRHQNLNCGALQNSPFPNSMDKKPLKNKDNFLKKSPNLPFRNSAKIGFLKRFRLRLGIAKRHSTNVELKIED